MPLFPQLQMSQKSTCLVKRLGRIELYAFKSIEINLLCFLVFAESQKNIQKHLKHSLRRRCQYFLSTDWLPVEKARNFSLHRYFVEGEWRKKVRNARKDTKDAMNNICDIFTLEYNEGAVNILAIGE